MKVYRFLNSEFALQAIRDKRLKVSSFANLNDPFELHTIQLTDKKLRRRFRRFRDDFVKQYRLICFCKTRREPLVWSHYADHHRGAALEVEVSSDIINVVHYQKARFDIEQERTSGGDQRLRDIGENLMRTKYEGWSYEKEARVYVSPNETIKSGLLEFYPFDEELRLRGLLIGPLSSITEKDVRSALPKGESILISKTRLAFKSYDVVLDQKVKNRLVSR